MKKQRATTCVLVVDDDENVQKMLEFALKSEGFKVLLAASAEEASILLKTTIPDAIILDVVLPGQNGFTFCANLRNTDRTEHIPILIITAKYMVSDRVKGLRMGADDYILKPFHIDEVVARVHAILRRSQTPKITVPVTDADVDITFPTFPVEQFEFESIDDELIPMEELEEDSLPFFTEHPTYPWNSVSDQTPSTPSKPVSPSDPIPPIQQQKQTPKEPPLKPDSGKSNKSSPVSNSSNTQTQNNSRFDDAQKLFKNGLLIEALQLFEEIQRDDPKDIEVRKYIEILKTQLMNKYMKVLGSKDYIPIKTSDNPNYYNDMDLSNEEGFIFSQVDGRTDFKGIVNISGMKPIKAYGILHHLLTRGTIKIKKTR